MSHWFRSYTALLVWTGLRSRATLLLNVIIQTLLAVGIIVGFGFLVPSVDPVTALFFASGAPVLGLVTVGMVIGPQEVASAKQEGIFEFNRSLPVPRSALVASSATVGLVTAIPGVLASLFVAELRFDLDYAISPLIVLAVLLTGLASIGIGYAIGYGLPPEGSRLVSQLVVFIALMFSPITFPASRLPGWFETIHEFLPFKYMGEAVRNTLVVPPQGVPTLAFVVLAVWAAAGFLLAFRMVSRRV